MNNMNPCIYCGGTGKYQYDGYYHMVVCTNPKCGYKTPRCPDRLIGEDEESKLTVFNYWNNGEMP